MKRELPKEYTELRNEIENDSKCCSVVALACVAGISGRKAQNALAKRGRRRHRGAYTHQLLQAVGDQGLTTRLLPKLTARYKTVRSLERGISGSRTLLVFTASHVLAVKGSTVCDWTSNRLHRIKAIYLVEKA